MLTLLFCLLTEIVWQNCGVTVLKDNLVKQSDDIATTYKDDYRSQCPRLHTESFKAHIKLNICEHLNLQPTVNTVKSTTVLHVSHSILTLQSTLN